MPLLHVVILAALAGATEALPLSRSGHEAAAQLFFPGEAHALATLLQLGTAVALAFSVRSRLGAALAEGTRAVARPNLFRESPAARDAAACGIAAVVSAIVSTAATPALAAWQGSALAAGIGLASTGLLLASTRLAPKHTTARPAPSLLGAAFVGAAHGLAVLPGASRVGSAFALLVWLGVRGPRALELALMMTIPTLVFGFVAGMMDGGASSLDGASAALCLLTAFLGAAGAAWLGRAMVNRRGFAALALWVVPLGLALIAYARAAGELV